MTARIFRPTYLIDELGELGRVPDGGILNIGGTEGPFFTVGGRPLLFADGSSTGPGGAGITLQSAYDTSSTGGIDLSSAKPFIISALNGKRFIVDAATGAITIEGDLAVLGDTVVIDKTIQNVDKLNIRLPTAATVGFDLRPDVGITPLTNLLEVRATSSGAPTFYIDSAGDAHAQNLFVAGTINGINLNALYNSYVAHTDASVVPAKHAATQVSYDQGSNSSVTGTTVQEALDSIEGALASFVASDVQGYEHIQLVPSATWTINHAGSSKKISVTIWDSTDEMVFADTVKLPTTNQCVVTFNTPIAGRAILMIF
jgi:hypothetical protein